MGRIQEKCAGCVGKTVDIISSTDVAAETAKLTQNQILQQVTAALLSQQSSSAYLALSLISG